MAYILVPLAIIIGVIWAMVVFPSFRVVVLIVVVLGAAAIFTLRERTAQVEKEAATKKAQDDEQYRVKFATDQKAYCDAQQKSWTIVSASQIEIRGPSLTQDQFYGSINFNYTLSASAKNKSTSKVTGLRLNVTALDCPAQESRQSDCEVIGHSTGTISTEIPPAEVRQINGKVELRDVPKPRGVFVSKFAVNAVRASINQADDTANPLAGIDVDDLFAQYSGYHCENAN